MYNRVIDLESQLREVLRERKQVSEAKPLDIQKLARLQTQADQLAEEIEKEKKSRGW